MKKKVSTLALIICVYTSMAFAGEKNKANANDNAAAATTQSQASAKSQDAPCAPVNKKDTKHANPAPSDQEKEFNKVLLGIYG